METAMAKCWHGVNLGGWLILEKWMQKTVFSVAEGTGDEYSLCSALGTKAEEYMRKHRETYITAEDFRFLRDYGIDAVRIPIGYWVIDPEGPYVGGAEMLDFALDQCQANGIAAIIDLHGAPGYQSTAHHTGRSNFFQWHREPKYLSHTLDVIEALAQRYKNHPGLGAISVLNEPSMDVPSPFLVEYYHQAYARIRQHISPEQAPVIIEAHPHFRLPEIHGKLQTLGCQNVITDVHPYQAYYDHYNRLEVHEHLATPMSETYPRLKEASLAGPLCVGEWSLTMGHEKKFIHLAPHQQDLVMRAYAAQQLAMFELATAGWFYWTYKTDGIPLWSFRQCVQRGWFPTTLTSATKHTGGVVPI